MLCAVLFLVGADIRFAILHRRRLLGLKAFRLRLRLSGGGQAKKFEFSTIGLLAAIGRRSGVPNILGVNFSGFIAWFLWRTIYLSKLPRLEKKVRVAIDWTLDLLFAKDLVHSMILRSPAASGREEPELEPLAEFRHNFLPSLVHSPSVRGRKCARLSSARENRLRRRLQCPRFGAFEQRQ